MTRKREKVGALYSTVSSLLAIISRIYPRFFFPASWNIICIPGSSRECMYNLLIAIMFQYNVFTNFVIIICLCYSTHFQTISPTSNSSLTSRDRNRNCSSHIHYYQHCEYWSSGSKPLWGEVGEIYIRSVSWGGWGHCHNYW